MLHPISEGEGNAVDSLEGILGRDVAQLQTLLEAPELDLGDVANAEALLSLDRIQARKGRVRPTASGPLLVVGKVNLDALTEVLAKVLGVRQVGPVRSKAALREVRTKAAGVGTPRDPLLHHGWEVHAPVLPGLGRKVLGEPDRIGHLLICELEESADRCCRSGGAPTAGAFARTAGFPDAHGLTHRDIVAHCDGLENLLARGAETSAHGERSGHEHRAGVPLGFAVAIVHVEECTRVGVHEDGAFHIQLDLGAPDAVATWTVDFLDRFYDARHRIVSRTCKCTTQQIQDSPLGQVFRLCRLRIPSELLHILDDL
mmetsp:Transcript_27480/g.68993  ORF Transcript_27480/g.68993 Transcript_27480/m.68993 type:complete len:315 (-) Transcript_27480:83-1027(-)